MMRWIWTIAIWLALGVAAQAQQIDLEDAQQRIAVRAEALERIGNSLNSVGVDLLRLRANVRELRSAAVAEQAPILSERADAQADLDRLGPPPEEGTPPEPEDILRERRRLNSEFAALDAAARQIELNIAEADRLLLAIASDRRDRFFEDLLARGPSPLSAEAWTEGAPQLARTIGAMGTDLRNGVRAIREREGSPRPALLLLLAVLAAVALLWPARRWTDAQITSRIQGIEPLPARKVLVAAGRMIARVAPSVVGVAMIYAVAQAFAGLSDDADRLLRISLMALVGVLAVDSATVSVLAPRQPDWRLLDVSTVQAISLRGLWITIAAVIGIDVILFAGTEIHEGSSASTALIQGVSALALALCLLTLLRPEFWRANAPEADAAATPSEPTAEPSEEPPAQPGPLRRRGLRRLAALLALTAIAATLIGYVALGHYLMVRGFALIGLAATIILFRALLREGVRRLDPSFRSGVSAQSEEGRPLAHVGIDAIISLSALAAFAPLAFLILGAEWADVRDAVVDAFFGFEVGNVRISLSEILTAFAVFAAILYATRAVQRTLDADVFAVSKVDAGVQNSLKTLIGYLGLVVAATFAVATLGVNLSNLAIIAGALSVGIGFGLQSIVNNFVSGLILLFERPIKVGDWIVTTSGEGYVRQIGVRSTQIETFDRSAVIVPNSELVSGAVTNWTYKDKMGRVIVPVGVAYHSDPEQVMALLEEVAREEPALMRYPAPFIYFANFGDSSLDFELRAYIWDINSVLGTKTKLRIAIFKKFKEHGVEVPFPQRDVHIRGGGDAGAADLGAL